MDQSLLQPQVSVSLITDDVAGVSPTYAIATAQVCIPQSLPRSQLAAVGLGAHQDPEIAQKIARTEAVERYATRLVPWLQLQYGTCHEDRSRVDPRTLYQLSAERARSVGLSTFCDSTSYYWTPARELRHNRAVKLLADLCYVYRPPNYPQRLAWVNSSGVAAHSCRRQAELSALLELYERDALMVAWIRRYEPPRVSFARLPQRVQASVENIQSLGYSCVSLDLTCRSVPVVLAVAHRPKWPALVVGMSARCSLQDALIGAWKEAEVEVFWRLREQQQDPKEPTIRMEEVGGVDDHAQFYNHPANTHLASFLWHYTQETARDLECCISAAEVFALDTVYEVEYAAVHGLQIVRLLTPNLVPVLFGFNQFPVEHPARQTCVVQNAGSRWPGTLISPPSSSMRKGVLPCPRVQVTDSRVAKRQL